MNLYDDIMQPTGTNNKIIRTTQNIFGNSECMFVEYNDVISSPYYVFMLNLIRGNNASDYFNFIFNKDIDDLEGKLFDWYINRKFINPFFSVGLKPEINENLRNSDGEYYEKKREMFLDMFLYKSMNQSPEVYNKEGYLNFANTLKRVIDIKNLVKTIIIYSENKHQGMIDDIKSLYGDSVIIKTGDLIEILSDDSIPKDTTYVFSDVNKVYALKDTNRLNNASILIADKFGYNYDHEGNLLLDPTILKDDKFTLSTFDNIHELELR